MNPLRRNHLAVVALAVLVAASGCTGVGGTNPVDTAETTVTTTETAQATTATDASTTTDAPETTGDAPPKGTQFVQVSALENQSSYREWPDAQAVRFETLSEPRKDAFVDALRNGSVRFEPNEDPPFSYYDDDRPRVVKYDDTWYYVRVLVV
ncbi:MAG: hypothetical protein ABEJ88_03115 [Halobacterium sp.]